MTQNQSRMFSPILIDEFEAILSASTSFFDPIRSKPIKVKFASADVKAYAPTRWMAAFPSAMITQTDAGPRNSGKYASSSYDASTANNLTFSEANKIFQTVRAHL